MSNSVDDFTKLMEELNNSLEIIDIEMNIDEDEEIQRLVKKCDDILKDGEKIDVIPKNYFEQVKLKREYKSLYELLNKYILDKRKELSGIEENIKNLVGFTNINDFATILNKKKDKTNQIINYINRIVKRLKELETAIYNNKIKELDNMIVEKYDVDIEMDIINDSMDVLKEWSNKNTFNIIFDSKVDGDGSNNVFYNRIFNKSNLYFISFDGNNNVYGGYLNTKIDKSGDFNYSFDGNAFIFSLIRNGKVNNKRYFIKHSYCYAFFFINNHLDGKLYHFGHDICVCKVGSNMSCCTNNDKYCSYDYKNDNKPLTDITHPNGFVVQRIVVLEMD